MLLLLLCWAWVWLRCGLFARFSWRSDIRNCQNARYLPWIKHVGLPWWRSAIFGLRQKYTRHSVSTTYVRQTESARWFDNDFAVTSNTLKSLCIATYRCCTAWKGMMKKMKRNFSIQIYCTASSLPLLSPSTLFLSLCIALIYFIIV